MTTDSRYADRAVEAIIQLLDIPPSYYEKARDRYESLSEWLHRQNSSLTPYTPAVYPQGSFRYGTVIRPLSGDEEYDLDLVCELEVSKLDKTQRQVKQMVGKEIKSYAIAKGFAEPASEKKRCWRLDYADEVSFHMDILPAVPEDEATKSALRALLHKHPELAELVDLAVAITDTRDRSYDVLTARWPMSNPRGFARWFEGRMRAAAQHLIELLVERREYASTEEVPPYRWKTPLQRAIQILKRHRDVMFRDAPDLKPISMMITTLAARSYEGETNLYVALAGIVEQMPTWINPGLPRIPNPTNPGEDFADAWRTDDRLEESFDMWHQQVKADIGRLMQPRGELELRAFFEKTFGLALGEERARELTGQKPASINTIRRAPPAVAVDTARAPGPWQENG